MAFYGYMQIGHAGVVQMLVDEGAIPDRPTPHNITALALAAEVSAL